MEFQASEAFLTRRIPRTLLFVLFASFAVCQDKSVNIIPRSRALPNDIKPSSTIRSDVKMVLVPANVTDHGDKPVLDLHKEDFQLYDDAVEQRIESFSIDQTPVSLGVVFDSSGSMVNKIDKSFKAVDQFLKSSLPGDEFFLLQFSDAPELRIGFTPDPDQIMKHLTMVQPKGWTAMFDAIYLAVHRMKTAKNSRKVLLILSDGGDNNSRYTEGEIISLLREADVQVYAVGLFDNAHFLKKAAADTGGHIVVVHNLDELPAAIDKLATQLRSQYMLGYYPSHSQNDGKYHKVKVQVLQPLTSGRLNTSWRHGYYAPF